ncbi:hypothetical protein D3C83_68140 [compost metagenome]
MGSRGIFSGGIGATAAGSTGAAGAGVAGARENWTGAPEPDGGWTGAEVPVTVTVTGSVVMVL